MDDKMIAYCGLDCSGCDAYLATQENKPEKLQAVAEDWSKKYGHTIEAEQVLCDGCKAGKRKSAHCKNNCKVRVCCLKKAINSCVECGSFPCDDEAFVLEHVPEAKSNLESINSRSD